MLKVNSRPTRLKGTIMMFILMTMQTLCVMFLAAAPVDRWNSASSPFKSAKSGNALIVVILIVSVILVCILCALHNQSVRRRKQRIAKIASTDEMTYEATPNEATPIQRCDRESPELVSSTEAV